MCVCAQDLWMLSFTSKRTTMCPAPPSTELKITSSSEALTAHIFEPRARGGGNMIPMKLSLFLDVLYGQLTDLMDPMV